VAGAIRGQVQQKADRPSLFVAQPIEINLYQIGMGKGETVV